MKLNALPQVKSPLVQVKLFSFDRGERVTTSKVSLVIQVSLLSQERPTVCHSGEGRCPDARWLICSDRFWVMPE